MATVTVRADGLDALHGQFDHARLRQGVFLNSVPKSGSHLLRNILRMFVPLDQQYRADFIQWATLAQHRAAFAADRPMLSWGHLFLADSSLAETAGVRRLLLVRDPYDWVIARARFFLSDQFDANLDLLKEGRIDADELLTLMIVGVPGKAPSLRDIYELNAAAWLGARHHLVRYEELVGALADLDGAGADYLADLLAAAGVERPDDWRQRVQIGSDRQHSPTAREQLTGIAATLPETLGPTHRTLVDFHAPGLRALLGYPKE